MSNKLTRKERGFVEDIVRGLPGVHAALNNYDTDNYGTAGAIAHENLRKPKIINALEEALPDKLLSQVHVEGLHAIRGVYKNNNETGEVEHVADEPDHSVRARYLDMAYKIKGSYAPEKRATLNVNVDVEDDPKIEELTHKLNELYKRTSSAGDGGAANSLDRKAQDKE